VRERRGEGERGDWARGDKRMERWLKLRIVLMLNCLIVQRFKCLRRSKVQLFKGSIVQNAFGVQRFKYTPGI